MGSVWCSPAATRNHRNFFCDSSARSGAKCSADGYCRCHDIPDADNCTCLGKIFLQCGNIKFYGMMHSNLLIADYGSCKVEISSSAGNAAAAVPSYRGSVQSTKSCTANDNCNYSVHVITVYWARIPDGSRDHAPGLASVRVTVDEDQLQNDTRPLILFFASYEPIIWSISMPQGINLEKIILVS